MIASLDFMLRVALDFPETAKTNFDELIFKGKGCVFVAEWLKTKGLDKLRFTFEGV